MLRETWSRRPRIWSGIGTLGRTNSRSNSGPLTPRGVGRFSAFPLYWHCAVDFWEKVSRVDLATVGGLNLGGTLDPVHNAVSVAELAVEKGATELLIPISSRRQLNDLSDDMATKLSILYYADAREALLKALGD